MTKNEITIQPSHVAVYRFIEKYMDKNIAAPQIKEIAVGIKLTPRQAYRLVEDLVLLGVLKKDAYKKRGLRIVQSITKALPT